jgi:hypothetical protein
MHVAGAAPLEVGSLVWQEGSLPPWLTVVCKATYRLLPGESILAPDREPIYAEDEPMGGDPARGLYAPADLVPRKARADVVLVGHAYAPRGEPVRSLVARLVVGPVDKEIEVFGDRVWTREGVLREVGRFARMPLSYDRAAGGPGTANPLGVPTGPAAEPDPLGAVGLPNLVPPGGGSEGRDDLIAPVGFGPLPASFPERWTRVGRQVVGAGGAVALDAPLPEGFDFGYFNAAPSDQQAPLLRDGERLILQNLHRDHARLMTALPAARPRAFAERAGAPPREVGLRCDALWIDTDRALCTLTWRGQLALASRDEPGRVICAMEEPGKRLAHEDVIAIVGAARVPSIRAEDPLADEVPTPPPPPPPPPVAPRSPVIELPPDDHDGPSTVSFPEAPAAPPPAPVPAFVATSRIAAYVPPEVLPFQSAPPAAPAHPIAQADPAAAPPPLPRTRGHAQTLAVLPGSPTTGPAWLNAPVPADHAVAAAAPRFGDPPPAAPLAARGRIDPRPARDAIELVWADPAAAPAIRRAFADLLADLPPPSGAEIHEAAVVRVFAAGRRCDAAGLEDAMAAAVGPDGWFRPPLVLVAADLCFAFDELEALRAMVGAARPFAAGDAGITAALDAASDLLAAQGPGAARSLLDHTAQRAREAFAKAGRALPQDVLGAEVQRLLLARRAYQRRALLGGPRIRALVTLPGADTGCPVYLPDALATALPMFAAFDARIVARAHPAIDQSEPHPAALEALALGRVVTPGKARR